MKAAAIQAERPRAPDRTRGSTVSCTYRVDEADCLIAVGPHWTRFAHRNGGSGLQPGTVLRTSLWRHITGLENRMVYAQIMQHVRETQRTFQFCFRCDAPDRQRAMRMEVTPAGSGHCDFTTVTLHERPRHYWGLLDPRSPKEEHLLLICNWCMRVQAGPSTWYEDTDARLKLQLRDRATWPRPVFTICPDCLDRLTGELNGTRP